MTTRGEEIDGAVIAAHKLARDQFEAFAGIGAGELPDDETNAMQVRLMRWQNELFGLQSDERFALGVIEECGETFEAENAEDAFDGLGDTMVWSGQIAIANRMAIAPLINLAGLIVARGPALPVLATSRLAQCVVKRAQRVRGMADDNAYRLRLASEIAECIAYSWETVAICHTDQPVDGAAVYRIVGAEVLKRKRGDEMIPKETVSDLEMAARDPVPSPEVEAIRRARKDAAMANLAAANVALGEAEKIEGPGDFVVADHLCKGSGFIPRTSRADGGADLYRCSVCEREFTRTEIAATGTLNVPPHAPITIAETVERAAIVGDAPGRHPALGFDTGGES